MTNNDIFYAVIIFGVIIIFLIAAPIIFKFTKIALQQTRYNTMGDSSQLRLVKQIEEATEVLSADKTGAIITILNKDGLEKYRTDGVKVDAAISASLLVAIFNKHSPLHDGAVIIDNNLITYASTYYKITTKSIGKKYGARHRAALWISEQTDSLTIVVSEETGRVVFAKNGKFTNIKPAEFQQRLQEYLS